MTKNSGHDETAEVENGEPEVVSLWLPGDRFNLQGEEPVNVLSYGGIER